MVIDTSALLAILQNEPERRAFNEAIERTPKRLLSAATLLEASTVMEARYGPAGIADLDAFLERADIEILPFDSRQAYEARRAFSRFGKGRHPAKLNLGDCFSYALARVRNEKLLFKGTDFSQTDLESAI